MIEKGEEGNKTGGRALVGFLTGGGFPGLGPGCWSDLRDLADFQVGQAAQDVFQVSVGIDAQPGATAQD